jgi:hypothetical protein
LRGIRPKVGRTERSQPKKRPEINAPPEVDSVSGTLPIRLHDEISADYKGMIYGTMATSSSTRHHFKELGLARTYVSSGTFGVANHPFPAVSPFVEVSRETGSDRLTGVCLVVRISRRRIDLEAGRFAVRAEPQVYPGER